MNIGETLAFGGQTQPSAVHVAPAPAIAGEATSLCDADGDAVAEATFVAAQAAVRRGDAGGAGRLLREVRRGKRVAASA